MQEEDFKRSNILYFFMAVGGVYPILGSTFGIFYYFTFGILLDFFSILGFILLGSVDYSTE